MAWSSAKMLHYQIQSQLNFYNLSTQHLELTYEPLEKSMKEYLEDQLKPFYEQIQSKKMAVSYMEYQHDDVQSPCHFDWKIYSEVMFHVFSNAVKYNRKDGYLNIEIRYVPELIINEDTGLEHQTGKTLLITAVTDSGQGIGSRVRNNIFKTFQRAMDRHNSILEAKGVGLGLSTARALLASLGGKIEIGTNKGEGTKVIFSMAMSNEYH